MKKLIGTISKNALEEVRVELTEFNGHDLLGVRIYAETAKSEDRVPTKKGITVKVEMLPDLVAALEKARVEAINAGMLD